MGTEQFRLRQQRATAQGSHSVGTLICTCADSDHLGWEMSGLKIEHLGEYGEGIFPRVRNVKVAPASRNEFLKHTSLVSRPGEVVICSYSRDSVVIVMNTSIKEILQKKSLGNQSARQYYTKPNIVI